VCILSKLPITLLLPSSHIHIHIHIMAAASSIAAREAFAVLRVVCVPLMETLQRTTTQSQSIEQQRRCLLGVGTVLEHIDLEGLIGCLDYALFPLLLLLRKADALSIHSTIRELALTTFKTTLLRLCNNRTEFEVSEDQFFDWLSVLLVPFTSPSPSPSASDAATDTLLSQSEEVLLLTIQSLQCIFDLLPHDLSMQYLALPRAKPVIACMICTMLDIAKLPSNKNKTLTLCALQLLQVLVHVVGDIDQHNHELQQHILPAVLPGIASGLAKVALGDYKQGHKIICIAIQCLAQVLVRVLSDQAPLIRASFAQAQQRNSTSQFVASSLRTLAQLAHNAEPTQHEPQQQIDNTNHQQQQQQQEADATDSTSERDKWIASTGARITNQIERVFALQGQRQNFHHWKVITRSQCSLFVCVCVTRCKQ
jgi:hypothetical protein